MFRNPIVCIIAASALILLSVADHGNIVLAALGVGVLAGTLALEA